MILTKEQEAILNGEKGETLAKVMKTLVMYGDAFEAEKLVPITSNYNHLVTSFGLKVMSPVYDLMQQLLDAGVLSGAYDVKLYNLSLSQAILKLNELAGYIS
jgi:hypothetical protein